MDSRAAIDSLLDAQSIFSRNDVKSELLKELERHSGVVNRIASNLKVDKSKLQETIATLDDMAHALKQANGKAALLLTECDLLKSISQRSAIPGGSCAFDLPAYYFWLQQSFESRQKDLQEWCLPFLPTKKAVTLILSFIRESAVPASETANEGFFQETLNQSQSFQLVRVAVERKEPYFVEISGGKHRYTIRFMEPSGCARPRQAEKDINFRLTRCLF